MHFDSRQPSDGKISDEITPGWQFAVASGILGWILDAFDFFVVVFLITELMQKLHVEKGAIVWAMTLTLAMRPVGALIFGSLADRFGRKKPLIVCVLYFSVITILSGFSVNYTMFLITRILYGIGMGGYWGIGASYAMESAPRSKRGFLSGMMQGGYPFGYLLASVGMLTVAPTFGWRAMFVVGSPISILIVVLAVLSPESTAWKMHRSPSFGHMFRTLLQHLPIFAYLLVVMTGMTCLSHGTQDLYPDFLKTLPFMNGATVLGMNAAFGIPVLYNIGAIIGALAIGHLSEHIGRRYAIIAALLIALFSIPAWAFGSTTVAILLGSYFMQTGVQGAFGAIPAHLNELSPDVIRGLFAGFIYQLGVLFGSPVLPIQNALRRHLGYPWALTSFESVVIICLLFIFALGPEKRGRDFRRPTRSGAPSAQKLTPERARAS